MSTLPRRTRIVRALTEWAEKGDPMMGRAVSVKLVHCGERSDRRLTAWPIQYDANGKLATHIGQLAETIEEYAKDHAANEGGEAIREKYNLVPYFGKEMTEGGVLTFNCDAALARSEDGESSSIGSYTEGATVKGIWHQGMRHLEGVTRAYLDKFDDLAGKYDNLMSKVMTFSESVNTDRLALMEKNKQMREEVEDAKDRGVERQLAVFRAYEEEKRTTKLIDLLQTIAPDLLGMALGRPILPSNSTDNTIKQIKNGLRTLSPEQIEAICQIVEAPLAMMIMKMKSQQLEEDEAEEKKRQAEAAQAVGGMIDKGHIKDEKVLHAVSKSSPNEITVHAEGSQS